MKKLRKVLTLSVLMLSFCSTAFAEGKIDPLLMIMANDPDAAVSSMKNFGAKAEGGILMTDVIVKARYGEAVAAKALIEQLGGTVRVVIEEIMTATIPFDAITALDDSELIEAVEATKPLTNKMNAARGATGSKASEVQAGTCTGCSPSAGHGYTGTGVIVGIVDSGIDCLHADFKNGTSATSTTRIVNYFDQGTNTDYTAEQISNGTCRNSLDDGGHGTHVAGIAAGSNGTYTGVASEASIIAVKYAPTDASSSGSFSTKVLEGANYIFTKADALRKTAVVNLSLGTSLGAHDGTSLMEQGLDALLTSSGTDKKGRAIVNAAGNENLSPTDPNFSVLGGLHAPINVTAGTNKGYEVAVRNSLKLVEAGGGIIDFWLDSNSTCTVKTEAYSNTTGVKLISMGFVAFGAATATATDNSATISLNFSETATSGKKHGSVTFNRASASVANTILENYYFVFSLSGTCTGNAWLYPDQTSQVDFTKDARLPTTDYTYAAGDSNMTITIPGTASKVITVASYMDRDTWVDINGATQNQTNGTCGSTGTTNLNISTFSSIGPTANTADLQKPDIAAPGEPIIASLASNVTADACAKGDATHYKLEGTSMASPHVAGTVALMFQKNNCLTAAEIKQYMRASAASDAQTGTTLPTYAWGYGKLNAAAVMNQFTANSTCGVTPTPTPSGSSSCSFAGDGDITATLAAIMSLMVGCGIAFYFAKRKLARRKS